MNLILYQIDAFTDTLFSGNPAAVCLLENWLDDTIMQHIAEENNLAETAFVVKNKGIYEIRWFTPELEVDLCGHATLAAAFVLFNYTTIESDRIDFYSPRSGPLWVDLTEDDYFILDFPKDEISLMDEIPEITNAIGKKPLRIYRGKTDYLLIYETQNDVLQIKPNLHLLDKIDARGIIVSAPGEEVDFVSRAFFPSCGIPEDPVTGSAHTTLTPYWSKVLEKTKLTAKQLSKRGGDLICEDLGSRIKIAGKAVHYMTGEISI